MNIKKTSNYLHHNFSVDVGTNDAQTINNSVTNFLIKFPLSYLCNIFAKKIKVAFGTKLQVRLECIEHPAKIHFLTEKFVFRR